MSWARVRYTLGPLALALAAAASSTSCRDDPPRITHGDPVFGEPAAITPATAANALRLARAILDGAPHPPLVSLAGARVFLTLHHAADATGRRAERIVETALDGDLPATIADAAERLRAETDEPTRAGARLQLDVVTSIDDEVVDRQGRYGLFVDSTRGHFVLPGEFFTAGLLGDHDDPHLDRAPLAARLGLGEHGSLDDARRFATLSVVEGAAAGTVRLLDHGIVTPTDAPPVDELVAHHRLGADYLVRALGDDGRFDYLYWASVDSDVDDYNDLRHAGTTYALYEAAAEHGDPRYLVAADRALAWIERSLVTTPEGALHLGDETNALRPIGGTGLLLLAMTKRAVVEHRPEDLPRLRSMAGFLVDRLDPDGQFLPYEDVADEPSSPCAYWPGEAVLALARMAEIDPDETQSARWLAAAEKGALYLVDHEDAYPSHYEREHDCWLAVALDELHRLSASSGNRARYLAHALFIARATLDEQAEDEAALDGETLDAHRTPRLSPTAVRLEAFAAIAELCKRAGRDDDAREVMGGAAKMTRTVLFSQYDAENAFYLRNPGKALGGFHGAIYASDVRIDHVQHAIVALAAYLRVLRGTPSPFERHPL